MACFSDTVLLFQNLSVRGAPLSRNRTFSSRLFVSACILSFVPGGTIRSASLREVVHGSISSHSWRNERQCLTYYIFNPALLEKFRKIGQSIKIWIRSTRKKYLADIANEVHLNSKRFWSFLLISFKNKRKTIPDKIYLGMDLFPTTLHAPTPFLRTFSPSTKITLVVAIFRRSLFLWIH